MAMLTSIDFVLASLAGWVWNLPLLLLILGGGVYFLFRSRFIPIIHIPYAVNILRGKFDRDTDKGQVSHYKALSVALASTIGMGNISGVAIAINMGGPGVVFWMWVTAIVGMATKYFTCTLAILYRGRDSSGRIEGGPMYFIVEGLGPKWRPLALFFCWAAMVGCLPVFTANQLTIATYDILLKPANIQLTWVPMALIGIFLAAVTTLVAFGGLQRIALVVSKLVPIMIVTYIVGVVGIIAVNFADVSNVLAMIISDAFAPQYYSGDTLFGGTLGGLIVLGARRGTFSNEAGIGTAPMAHGAAKTNEPVHEGMVAMLGPAIDTLLVCSLTAFAILISGAWVQEQRTGIELTLSAFATAYSGYGAYLLYVCVLFFALSSLFSYYYYGLKSAVFVFGRRIGQKYKYYYVVSIFVAAVAPAAAIINAIDIAFALMAIPTITATILLSDKVVGATRAHFSTVVRRRR